MDSNIIYLNRNNQSISFRTMDITTSDTQAIVNAANRSLMGGGGVDAAIHRAAGMGLRKECMTLGGCKKGEAKITKGYNLKAEYIIHTVGPVYSGSKDDIVKLSNCYLNSLELAKQNDIHSIAFPAISTGAYGFPLESATLIALATVKNWIEENKNYKIDIIFTNLDDNVTKLYNNIWIRYYLPLVYAKRADSEFLFDRLYGVLNSKK